MLQIQSLGQGSWLCTFMVKELWTWRANFKSLLHIQKDRKCMSINILYVICKSFKSLVIVGYNFLFPWQIWEAFQLRKKKTQNKNTSLPSDWTQHATEVWTVQHSQEKKMVQLKIKSANSNFKPHEEVIMNVHSHHSPTLTLIACIWLQISCDGNAIHSSSKIPCPCSCQFSRKN